MSRATATWRRRALALLGGAGIAAVAQAQMYLPDPAIEVDDTTNVYFGATRDASGRPLADVTVSVGDAQVTYVMVTDAEGRYRIRVPKALAATRLRVQCSRSGYVLRRVVRRPPPRGATSPIQADCELAPKQTGAP